MEMVQAVVRATLGGKTSVFSLERSRSRVPEAVAHAAAFLSPASGAASLRWPAATKSGLHRPPSPI